MGGRAEPALSALEPEAEGLGAWALRIGLGRARFLRRRLSLPVSTISQFEPVREATKRLGDASRPNG